MMEYEPNCLVRSIGEDQTVRWVPAYLPVSAIPIAVERGKARWLHSGEPAVTDVSAEVSPGDPPGDTCGAMDLESYTLVQLREMATELGVPYTARTPKGELIALISEHAADD